MMVIGIRKPRPYGKVGRLAKARSPGKNTIPSTITRISKSPLDWDNRPNTPNPTTVETATPCTSRVTTTGIMAVGKCENIIENTTGMIININAAVAPV